VRIGVVVNPTSGAGRGAALGRAVSVLLTADGHEVADLSGPTAALARTRAGGARPGLDVLAVVGGDGMAHLGTNVCAGTATPLALVAGGTGNDVARALGLPLHDARAAAAVITTGHLRRVDAGRLSAAHAQVDARVESAEEEPPGAPPQAPPGARAESESPWFVGVLGAGFDAVVNERANGWVWPRGRARYLLAIGRELPVFRPLPYVLTVDETRLETEAMLVAVANGPSYGGGMRVCPDAQMDDGLFDVLVLGAMSTATFVRVFPRVFSGGHTSHPAVRILRGRRVHLQAPGIVGYADGERFAPLPMGVEVVPGALRVLVPADTTS